LAALFESGAIVDAILLLMILQGLGLKILHQYGWRIMSPVDYLFTALPGAFLLLALRAALVNAEWFYIAASLLAAFCLHWSDLVRRSASSSKHTPTG
jgi:hypothetical protein